jgi:hypothetical protein
MEKWSADFVNNPNEDYNLMVEILYDEEEIAVVKKDENGRLIMKWYPTEKELLIPVDWLIRLLAAAKERL